MRYAKSGREVKCTKGDNRFLEVRVEVMYSDVEPLRVLSHSPSKKPGYQVGQSLAVWVWGRAPRKFPAF